MTRRRWIADEVDFGKGRAALTGEHADHLIRVLRTHVGQEFDVVVGPDHVHRARVVKIEDARVVFELEEQIAAPRTSTTLTLLLSVFKFDRMEWAIEKAVELGVSSIVPIIATRTQKHLATVAPKRVQRWRRIAQQAAEQSRREGIPDVALPVTLERAIEAAKRGIVLAEYEADLSLRECLQALPLQGTLSLAIGPEGGWTSEELRHFADAGWQRASLGGNILRAETAAVAALAIVISELQST
jgi:16S rRNA (uracil1498-N3)-methyltransferase